MRAVHSHLRRLIARRSPLRRLFNRFFNDRFRFPIYIFCRSLKNQFTAQNVHFLWCFDAQSNRISFHSHYRDVMTMESPMRIFSFCFRVRTNITHSLGWKEKVCSKEKFATSSRDDTQPPYAQAMPKVRRFLRNERIERLVKELRLD